MNARVTITAGFLAILSMVSAASVFAGDKVRNWRSTGGKSIRGELVEVRDGKAIIRPETKLIEAPLEKLTETDREYVEVWRKEREALAEARKEADMLLAKSRPLGKALIGRTVKVKGKTVEQHEIENIGKLKYVLLYRFTEDTLQNVKALNRLYARMHSRYDSVEFIAIPSVQKGVDADKLLLENDIEFPAVRMSALNSQDAQPIAQLFDRPVVPQIAVIDVNGKIVSDSYRAPDPTKKQKKGKAGEWTGPKQDMEHPMEEIQKLARAASTGDEAKEKE